MLAGSGSVRERSGSRSSLVACGACCRGETPVRQAYLNDMIPSKQRATVLSFDSLMGSAGGVVIQPVLGRVADVGGYARHLRG